MKLSDDQEAARATILAAIKAGAKRLTLSGPAGSGKTTLMRTLISDLAETGRTVHLLAPTGKASARLRDLTGRDTSTIHRAIYKKIIEKDNGAVEFADPRSAAGRNAVIICDEASMIGRVLYADLAGALPGSAVLLCVGDREQLSPVGDTWGADFASPTAILTQVHRQAQESPIIALATSIRTGGDWREAPRRAGYMRRRTTLAGAAGWLAVQRALGVDSTLLTFSNRARSELNSLVRAARGHADEITVGDILVCTRNAHAIGVANGETKTVKTWDYTSIDRQDEFCDLEPWIDAVALEFAEGPQYVDHFGEKRPILVVPDFLDGGAPPARWRQILDEMDPRQRPRLMQAEFGEALTVHKSQGSQWESVGIVHDRVLAAMETRDGEAYRRILYTAVTRAAKDLVIFEV